MSKWIQKGIAPPHINRATSFFDQKELIFQNTSKALSLSTKLGKTRASPRASPWLYSETFSLPNRERAHKSARAEKYFSTPSNFITIHKVRGSFIHPREESFFFSDVSRFVQSSSSLSSENWQVSLRLLSRLLSSHVPYFRRRKRIGESEVYVWRE